jgi:hypothetical protein
LPTGHSAFACRRRRKGKRLSKGTCLKKQAVCIRYSAILYIPIDNPQKIAIKYHKQHAVPYAEIRDTPALNRFL